MVTVRLTNTWTKQFFSQWSNFKQENCRKMSLLFRGHNKPEPQWNALLATGAHTISGRLDAETLKTWMRHAEFWIYFCTLYQIHIHAFMEIYLIAFCCWKVYHTCIAWSGLRGYLYGRMWAIRKQKVVWKGIVLCNIQFAIKFTINNQSSLQSNSPLDPRRSQCQTRLSRYGRYDMLTLATQTGMATPVGIGYHTHTEEPHSAKFEF